MGGSCPAPRLRPIPQMYPRPPPPYDGYAPSLFGKKDWHAELEKAAAFCGAAKPDLVQVLVSYTSGCLLGGGVGGR